MLKTEYDVIGVMSGTSLDGVDLVHVTFFYDINWHYKIHEYDTISYDTKWFNILKQLSEYSLIELRDIDARYTTFLADIIQSFISDNNIENIDAVCTHGHTALHQPENKLTYQIGNLPEIADILNLPVVCDFRVQDVKLGGQGAPLVPIGDRLLFSEYDYCLNLGGFANISMEANQTRIAYDICPVNIVLNTYARALGVPYDDSGLIALSGTINKGLLQQLNALEYYTKSYPKSLGVEWVNSVIIPIIESYQLDTKDILRTYVEHIAIQIKSTLVNKSETTVLVTGGGAFNTFLIDRIRFNFKGNVCLPENELINYKEALIFGLLGVLKLRDEINCLSSVTGSKNDHSSGRIYLS